MLPLIGDLNGNIPASGCRPQRLCLSIGTLLGSSPMLCSAVCSKVTTFTSSPRLPNFVRPISRRTYRTCLNLYWRGSRAAQSDAAAMLDPGAAQTSACVANRVLGRCTCCPLQASETHTSPNMVSHTRTPALERC